MGDVTTLKPKKKTQRKKITVIWGGSRHPITETFYIAKEKDCGLIGEMNDILSILTEDGSNVNYTIGSVLKWLEEDAAD